MKNLIMIIFICLVVSIAAAKTYEDIEAKFIRNYDGDTLTVDVNDWPPIIGERISVRINGIDTPEIRGGNEQTRVLAKKAKLLVNFLLRSSDTIILKNPHRGKYFRIVADVEFSGIDLGEILIALGYAVEYKGDGPRPDWTKILTDPNDI